jgi:hypothetical protein
MIMAQIKESPSGGLSARLARARVQVAHGLRWWAEHQAWPATDEIRIDHRQRRF